MELDTTSIFVHDGEGEPDIFSLVQVNSVVDAYFKTSFHLRKLADGSYYKVGITLF